MARGYKKVDSALLLDTFETNALINAVKLRYISLWKRRENLTLTEQVEGQHLYEIMYALGYPVMDLPYPDITAYQSAT